MVKTCVNVLSAFFFQSTFWELCGTKKILRPYLIMLYFDRTHEANENI